MSEPLWQEEFVETSDSVIQVKVTIPEKIQSRTMVVVTHPYGMLGGDLDNPVCMAIGRTCGEKGYVTVRLNFRGSGESSGAGSWRGSGEQEDVLAIIKHYKAHPCWEGTPPEVCLIGYSYGSLISGSLVTRPEASCKAYVGIAYPHSVAWALTLFRTSELLKPLRSSPSVPKLFFHGTRDQFTSLPTAVSRVESMGNSASLATLDGADHFFGRRKTAEIVSRISTFLDTAC